MKSGQKVEPRFFSVPPISAEKSFTNFAASSKAFDEQAQIADSNRQANGRGRSRGGKAYLEADGQVELKAKYFIWRSDRVLHLSNEIKAVLSSSKESLRR